VDPLAQVGQLLVVYSLILLITIYLSVAIALGLERLAADLPWPLKDIVDFERSHDSATLGGATLGTILLCFFHIPPIAVLIWPSNYVSLPGRLVSLLLFAAEAVWFAYLRNYLVKKKR
jgi:hypothetical protein